MGSVPERWVTPSSASVFGHVLAKRARHPDEFDCAVRVVAGAVPGESARWRYRRSAVDPLMPEWDEITLNHGPVVLRLCFAGASRVRCSGVRPYHRIWTATEVATGAAVEIAADAGEAVRFRLDA